MYRGTRTFRSQPDRANASQPVGKLLAREATDTYRAVAQFRNGDNVESRPTITVWKFISQTGQFLLPIFL